MPGGLWALLLLSLGGLYLAAAMTGSDSDWKKPMIRRGKDNRYYVEWRGTTHGPFMTFHKAHRAAVNLVEVYRRAAQR